MGTAPSLEKEKQLVAEGYGLLAALIASAWAGIQVSDSQDTKSPNSK
jgi:hypothetical protein